MEKEQATDDLLHALDRAPEGPAAGGDSSVGPRSSDEIDLVEIQRVIVELASDWAFVIRLDADGGWELEWIDGSIPVRPDLDVGQIDKDAWSHAIFEEDRPTLTRHFVRAMDVGRARVEYRLDLPGVGLRWVESSIRVVKSTERSRPTRVYGTVRDVSERRATEDALRGSESQYRALVEQASDGILVFEESGRMLTSNPAAHELFGLERDPLHERTLDELLRLDDPGNDALALQDLKGGSTLRRVCRIQKGNAESWVWVEASARRLLDRRMQVTVRDISDRIEAERRIRNLAYFDSLTGLPNRELFREQIDRAIERSASNETQLALLFLDVDRFKQVNDSLGHSTGDLLLEQVAERLRTVVRGSDSIGRVTGESEEGEAAERWISRLGGDEFTFLIPDLDHPQDAARVARRVLHALSRGYSISDQEIFVGSSIGIAVWPDDGENSEILLRSADTAMYHAKARGGNAYEFFNASMNVTSTRRLNLESGLRRALERDEFRLVYQPIRDARTGRLSAAEALLRWVDSDGQAVSPDEFIPVAEETGLIIDIGTWVLRTACHQAQRWKADGHAAFRMSVNIAVEQLRDLGIVEAVDQMLYETGLSPSELELEITETSILDADPIIVAAIGALTDMGVGFALDDFGTGYSSLSVLQRFPIERLKIDRSFVSGVGESRSDRALTSAIVALAKRLDLSVVAEGVETEEQVRFLSELGCDELQGYLFSRPLPPEDFERFLVREAKGDT
ncbi:MAG: GGDEF domain-containing protein [Deltaproteobacteria bacterium]|nr:GGDEF domain-containing protein [Deltaproteobacteria bacterium]